MLSKRYVELTIIIFFFVFSVWLFNKSFGYDVVNSAFRISRNQVGDFGLHLSLIRSFSWGMNFPPQSPFYPGTPLRYHFVTDMVTGLLERSGIRIDYAYNGLSSIVFTILLYLIYKIPQKLFGKSAFHGFMSAVLFLFPSTLTWIDFLKDRQISLSMIRDIWYLPDYIHRGPFDGSVISLYFTLNPYLNQRHLIAGAVIGLIIFYNLAKLLLNKKPVSARSIIFLAIINGLSFFIHSLIAFSTLIMCLMMLLQYRKFSVLTLYVIFAILASIPFIWIYQGGASHAFINPGFIVEKPFTIVKFAQFWWLNLGLSIPLGLYGLWISKKRERIIFTSFFVLFILANLFQFSYRIEHNHSMINFFLIGLNWFVGYALVDIWRNGRSIFAMLFFIVLVSSGVLNMMAIKNDYQFTVADAPANQFMDWIRNSTDKRAVFLSREEQYDPVTLSGRYSFVGHDYYVGVFGYETAQRKQLAKEVFEAKSPSIFERAKAAGIEYIVMPKTNRLFETTLPRVYEDRTVVVYSL